jgi:hypothetical protein
VQFCQQGCSLAAPLNTCRLRVGIPFIETEHCGAAFWSAVRANDWDAGSVQLFPSQGEGFKSMKLAAIASTPSLTQFSKPGSAYSSPSPLVIFNSKP